ncbi:putative voltage-dependent channel domain superfamily, voltage-gated hydrogen channel 1 [Helianthus annuus]|nr:putative voltage-dependent channel domain superfamily, voltage-gated hydrogen channel 1 [Helianthus annuus]
MDSSQIQHHQPQPPPTAVISTESIHLSIQNVIKSCKRRRKWEFFSGSTKQTSNNKPPWRNNLTRFLESTPVHIIAIVLLIVDLVMVVLELSKTIVSCPASNRINKKVDLWYHRIGIGILVILATKSVALVVGCGSSFFKRPGLVADGAVVLIGALLSEILLERVGVGLIVVVSLWRVLRVVESAFELSDAAIEAQITSISCQFELLQEENVRLNRIIEELQEQLDNREKCSQV